jgi:endogenous inhibitor of DNA gyrase (YacG/DUF329 family)
MVSTEKTRRCPTCNKVALPRNENEFSPFCSERCQLADLGRWLDEDYVIPGPPDPYVVDD